MPRTDIRGVVDRLSAASERNFYNPYELLQWPASLPEHQYWMPPELLTTHGTAVDPELTEEQRWALSKWESVNFYSLNVHGIRELLMEVVQRIYTDRFSRLSEYLHHIIGEENAHMWFFAKFCLLYGGKIYPNMTFRIDREEGTELEDFLVFARLLIFEELVDVFNRRAGSDERLDPTIRTINELHHRDESRHIAFGRSIACHLFGEAKARVDESELAGAERYLKRYMVASVASLSNPAVYADAGLQAPYRIRRELLADPAHVGLRDVLLGRSVDFFVNERIFSTRNWEEQ